MKKNKVIILTSIIVGVLVVTLGLTYAAITFNETKGNSQLVLGDIYMHYGETNQLVLNDAMPMDINDYITYKVNPVMASQEVVDNELTKCVNYIDVTGMPLSNGTIEDFCKGTGTAGNGYTFQQNLDNGDWFPENVIQVMLSLNVIVENGESYIVNPIMASQEVVDNELSMCIIYLNESGMPLVDGTTMNEFCKGTGLASNGYTFQENLDNEDCFPPEMLNYFLGTGITLQQIENLPYFEFTINGKNTYTKEDIWYEIVLNQGDEHTTRTTRIRDDLLRFTLVEVANGNNKLLLSNRKYKDLSNQRIYVDTIPANTNEEINKTYRLYMWISEDTVIGNANEDYTFDEWNDVYASIKVSVTGDFNEKELAYEDIATDASCFEFEEMAKYIYNSSITEEEVALCITYLVDAWGPEDETWKLDEGETYESFCQGTGTSNGLTFQEKLDYAFLGTDDKSYFFENNIITLEYGVAIIDYDATCGPDVVIPVMINGYNVLEIEENAFHSKNLASVILPNTLKEIGSGAFYGNNLTSVIFPNSLKTIYEDAFRNNGISEVEIPNSVTKLSCVAFDGNVIINKNSNLICMERPS